MRNERLRALLLERGESLDKLAEAVHVDPKTVERWITTGRVPYRKHRFDVATFFGVDESYIWPDALGRNEVAAVSQSEVVAVWPHRWAVPRDTWGHFFSQAEREIGALVYSGMFMAEDIGVHRLFADRARAGVSAEPAGDGGIILAPRPGRLADGLSDLLSRDPDRLEQDAVRQVFDFD